uniref:Uncharacterized protein n=1 Tax=Mycena chlorophos TaxID=658473 RepID=A0ABQ0LDZ0_MYCCL|nr:predicted protein [Mycena chlorophos]
MLGEHDRSIKKGDTKHKIPDLVAAFNAYLINRSNLSTCAYIILAIFAELKRALPRGLTFEGQPISEQAVRRLHRRLRIAMEQVTAQVLHHAAAVAADGQGVWNLLPSWIPLLATCGGFFVLGMFRKPAALSGLSPFDPWPPAASTPSADLQGIFDPDSEESEDAEEREQAAPDTTQSPKDAPDFSWDRQMPVLPNTPHIKWERGIHYIRDDDAWGHINRFAEHFAVEYAALCQQERGTTGAARKAFVLGI